MSKFPRRVEISRDGVFVDGVEIPGVCAADVSNINPGHSGAISVTLVVKTKEVDVQYSQLPKRRMEDVT